MGGGGVGGGGGGGGCGGGGGGGGSGGGGEKFHACAHRWSCVCLPGNATCHERHARTGAAVGCRYPRALPMGNETTRMDTLEDGVPKTSGSGLPGWLKNTSRWFVTITNRLLSDAPGACNKAAAATAKNINQPTKHKNKNRETNHGSTSLLTRAARVRACVQLRPRRCCIRARVQLHPRLRCIRAGVQLRQTRQCWHSIYKKPAVPDAPRH